MFWRYCSLFVNLLYMCNLLSPVPMAVTCFYECYFQYPHKSAVFETFMTVSCTSTFCVLMFAILSVHLNFILECGSKSHYRHGRLALASCISVGSRPCSNGRHCKGHMRLPDNWGPLLTGLPLFIDKRHCCLLIKEPMNDL